MNLVKIYIDKQQIYKVNNEMVILFKNGSEIRTVQTSESNRSISGRGQRAHIQYNY